MDDFFTNALSGAFGGIASKVLDGPFQSLNDLWFASIGFRFDLLRQKAATKNKLQIQQYAEDIVSELKDIPEEFVKEPDFSIAGPALEASTYYVNNDLVREMFAKLVASSVDERKQDQTRSVFVEFVKQMNTTDAKLLNFIGNKEVYPLADLEKKLDNGALPSSSKILPLGISNDESERILFPSAITNLDRMKLLEVSYETWLSSYDYEFNFKKTPEYSHLLNLIASDKHAYELTQDSTTLLAISEEQRKNLKILSTETPHIKPGTIKLSSLGKDFVSVCL